MSYTELVTAVRSLEHRDKLRLLQFLAGELANEEGLAGIQPGTDYPVWSPYDAIDASRTLQGALDAERAGGD